jgi:uncharacterized protein (DUF488 family)
MQQTVYTIGHSMHERDKFLGLLSKHGITALCDIRSTPYSRFHPYFNRLVARHLVAALGIDIQHIHEDGSLESHDNAMARLAQLLRMPEEHMFHSREDLLDDVYRRQEERIAPDKYLCHHG